MPVRNPAAPRRGSRPPPRPAPRGARRAVRLEKDTLTFLAEVQGLVADRDSSIVRAIMDEERNHLRELAALRRTLD